MAIQVSTLGPGTAPNPPPLPPRQKQEPPGSGNYLPLPTLTHTRIKISTISTGTSTHVSKDTSNRKPLPSNSNQPLPPWTRNQDIPRSQSVPSPASGCHHNCPISHTAVLGQNSSHRRITLSPVPAGWVFPCCLTRRGAWTPNEVPILWKPSQGADWPKGICVGTLGPKSTRRGGGVEERVTCFPTLSGAPRGRWPAEPPGDSGRWAAPACLPRAAAALPLGGPWASRLRAQPGWAAPPHGGGLGHGVGWREWPVEGTTGTSHDLCLSRCMWST